MSIHIFLSVDSRENETAKYEIGVSLIRNYKLNIIGKIERLSAVARNPF